MDKLKIFWRTFIKSLKTPSYYNDIKKSSFSFSLKYLLILTAIVLLIKGLSFSAAMAGLLPKVPSFVRTAKSSIAEFFPERLTVTVNNGTVRTNVDEPYAIPFPKQLGVKDVLFAVIDTKAPIDDAKKYKSVLFVNRNAIAYPDSETEGGYKVYFLNNHKGYFIANKSAYDRTIAQVLPFIDYVPFLLYFLIVSSILVAPFIGSVFVVSGLLFYILIMSVFFYIIAWLMKKKLDFWTIYRMAMHGITFSVVFDLLKSLFGVQIPFTYTFPYIIWMVIVFNSIDKAHESGITPAQPVR